MGEAISPQIAPTVTKMKKGELVEAAEKHLSGLRWLPNNLKTDKASQDVRLRTTFGFAFSKKEFFASMKITKKAKTIGRECKHNEGL